MTVGFAGYTLATIPNLFQYGPNDNAERVVLSTLLKAQEITPGTLLTCEAGGRISGVGGSPVYDFRMRLGPTTLTGTILGKHSDTQPVADLTWRIYSTNNVTDAGFWIRAQAAVQADGTSVWAAGFMVTSAAGVSFQFNALPVTQPVVATINPTIDNLLELTVDVDDNANNNVYFHSATFGMEWSA